MKTAVRFCVTGLLLLSPTAAADEPAPGPTGLFSSLWAQRHIVQVAHYRLRVVELLSPKPGAKPTGNVTVHLRLLVDLSQAGKESPPQEVKVTANVRPPYGLCGSGGDGKHYLAMTYNHNFQSRKIWRLHPVCRPPGPMYYLIGLDGPGGVLVQVVRELMFGVGPDGKPVKKFERMLHHVRGSTGEGRDFAASFASVNGWGFVGGDDTKGQPDAFARVLLAAKDHTTRRRLARAYSAAAADLLPRDDRLLEQIFHHADEQVLTPALRDNLRHAAARAGELADLVRAALTGRAGRTPTRKLVLRALTAWGEKALICQAELRALARAKAAVAPTHADRVTALRILLAADADGAAALARETLVDAPSAVALEYAVRQKLYAVVPAVIRAARDGKLVWSDAHSAALSLLTRSLPGGPFEKFDQWWAQVERAGQADAAVAAGFADPEKAARAARLIDRLGSSVYADRRAARQGLAKLGVAVLPALLDATRHRDPEIASAASHLVAQAKGTLKGCEDRLAAAANAERAGSKFLPLAGDTPQTQPADAEVERQSF